MEAGSNMTSLSGYTRIPVLTLLGAIAAGVLLHALHTVLGFGGPSVDSWFDDYLYNAVLIAAAAACLLRGVSVADERWAWLAFGTGLAFWGAGDLYWTVVLSGQSHPPYPSAADLLFLAGYPALFAGIVLLVKARVPRFGSSMWLDGGIGALAAAALGTALLHPALTELAHGTRALTSSTIPANSAGYPARKSRSAAEG